MTPVQASLEKKQKKTMFDNLQVKRKRDTHGF